MKYIPLKYLFLVFFTSILVTDMLVAQEGDKPKKKERVRMTLSYTNMSNNGSRLLAAAKAKIDRSYAGVDGIKIKFYHDSVSRETYFGSMMTDQRGEANYPIPEEFRKPLKYDSTFVFIAEFEGNEEYRSADVDVEIINAVSKLTFEEKDSLRYVHYFVGVPTDSAKHYEPVEDVEGRIYVKRLFGLLPISEEFAKTDENGYLTIEFPKDIRGDENGEVIVIGKVNDHFEYGNLQYAETINWAMPLQESQMMTGRELWSAAANAPIWLVATVLVILLGIWGTILYIIYQMFRIKRLGANVT